MPATASKLTSIVEDYLSDLRHVRASAGATAERSTYGPLANLTGDDFALTTGWGHFGSGQAVMPGQGRAVEREYTDHERAALGDAVRTLGDTTFDIYLNHRAYWRNIPSAVWIYKLGGYQVLKKWLSYRERKVLSRPLHPQEVNTQPTRRDASLQSSNW